MQAILLLGGKNSRFFPLETMGHKAMRRIYGKPLLEYTVNDLITAGITNFIIVNGKYDEEVKNYFGDGGAFGIKIKYANQLEPRGQGNAILSAKELISEDFIIPNPYHVLQADVYKSIIEKFNSSKADGVIPGMKVDDIENYGALKLEGEKVLGIVEKPEKGTEPSNYKATSAYILRRDFLEFLERVPESEYSYETACSNYSQEKNVLMIELSSDLQMSSIKYPWHLLNIRDLISQKMRGSISKDAFIAKNAIVEDSVIVESGAKVFEGACIKGKTYVGKNAVIGNNAVVRDSDIGDDVQVGINSDIARSIIMKDTHFHGGGFIGDSIVGEDCRIAAGFITANKKTDRSDIYALVKGERVNTKAKALGVVIGKEVKFGINSSVMPGKMIGEKSVIGPGVIVFSNLESNSRLSVHQKQELKKPIKAIFFDQDNTLFNSAEISKEVYQFVFQYLAQETSNNEEELYKLWSEYVDFIRNSSDPKQRSLKNSFTYVLNQFNLDSGYAQKMIDIFSKKLEELISTTNGVKDFFELDKKLIYILFTEDPAEFSKIKVGKFGLESKFDLIITSNDMGTMKPDIKYLEVAWKKFNLKPEECMYVGDKWEKDCKLGQEMGGIGVIFGSKDDRANYCISNMLELEKILLNQ